MVSMPPLTTNNHSCFDDDETTAAFSPVAGAGACTRCASEIAAGQRPQDKQCFLFDEAYDGGSVCQTCSHSWHDHR